MNILFEAESRDLDPVAIVEDRKTLSQDQNLEVPEISAYTEQIVNGVAIELDAIDEVLAENIANTWELDRLPAVDRAIIRVALWELLFNSDVPVPTAVVEAVEIASEYSTDQSSAYINATLDSVAAKITEYHARLANTGDAEPATTDDDEPPSAAEPVA